jgi:hypothetical protein
MHNPPSSYLPLLLCPACDIPTLLEAPTTLHCGHTICSSHFDRQWRTHSSVGVYTPSCPLPACPSNSTQTQSININIPSNSRVAYFPAPNQLPAPSPSHNYEEPIPDSEQPVRMDITVSKIISLIRRTEVWVREDEMFVDGNDSGTDDRDDTETETPPPSSSPDPHSSGSRPRSTSLSSPTVYKPPRKCRRAGGTGNSEAGFSDEGRPAQTKFEKDLMTELTCEICFMLLYQPVTTPCQHASPPLLSMRLDTNNYPNRHSAQNASTAP